MKKRIFKPCVLFFASLATLAFVSCSDENKEDEISYSTSRDHASCTKIQCGTVKGFDSYGMLQPSFSVNELKGKGFDYADLVNVQVGDSIFLKDVPFVTGFNEVGMFEPSLCDYNAKGTTFGFGQLHGNFQKYIGGHVGDTVIVTLSKKGGYSDYYKVMHSVYDTVRSKYGTDEKFANFREIHTGNIANGKLYRSSNPLNPKDNAVRYAYVDRLAQQVGIKTEIDLADTDEKIRNFIQTEGFASTYCPKLFENNNVIALGLDAAVFSKDFMNKLGNGLRFMTTHEAPYLVHCNEGKDRCGFVSLLLEALTGASYEEVADDYMTTISNFYLVKKGDNDYNVRQKLSVERLVWMLGNYKNVQDFSSIDWNNIKATNVDLKTAAHNYVIDCGLSEAECQTLIGKLTKE